MLCQECPKKESCVELCLKAERWINKDHVSQREITFPNIGRENLNTPLDNLNHHKTLHSLPELVSFFNEDNVNFPFLSGLQNKCLHLFYFQGLTYKQIAMRVNRRVKDVDNCIYRAKQLISRNLFYNERGENE